MSLSGDRLVVHAGDVRPTRAPERGPSGRTSCPTWRARWGPRCVSFFMLLVIGFVIFSLMPADPVSALTRGRPTADAQMSHLRHELGLDQPLWERFLTFVGHTLTGNLGYSWEYHQSVSSLIAEPDVADAAADGDLDPDLHLAGDVARDPERVAARQPARPESPPGSRSTLWSVPTFWLGLILLVLFGSGSVAGIPAIFPAGGMQTQGTRGRARPGTHRRRRLAPRAALPDAGGGDLRAVRDDHAVVDHRRAREPLPADRAGQGPARRGRTPPGTPSPTRCCPSVTVIFLQIGGDDRRRDHRRGGLLLAGARLPDLHRAPDPRPAAARGHLHRLQRRGDRAAT